MNDEARPIPKISKGLNYLFVFVKSERYYFFFERTQNISLTKKNNC